MDSTSNLCWLGCSTGDGLGTCRKFLNVLSGPDSDSRHFYVRAAVASSDWFGIREEKRARVSIAPSLLFEARRPRNGGTGQISAQQHGSGGAEVAAKWYDAAFCVLLAVSFRSGRGGGLSC